MAGRFQNWYSARMAVRGKIVESILLFSVTCFKVARGEGREVEALVPAQPAFLGFSRSSHLWIQTSHSSETALGISTCTHF